MTSSRGHRSDSFVKSRRSQMRIAAPTVTPLRAWSLQQGSARSHAADIGLEKRAGEAGFSAGSR